MARIMTALPSVRFAFRLHVYVNNSLIYFSSTVFSLLLLVFRLINLISHVTRRANSWAVLALALMPVMFSTALPSPARTAFVSMLRANAL